MTTPPLPPLPEPEGQRLVDLTPAVYAMWERQMKAYAFAARADLEAENKRLREALKDIARQPEGDEDSAQAVARAALKDTK